MPLHGRAAARPRRRGRSLVRAASPRRQARPRVAGGVLWIVIVAVLLAGIVALNVAVLRLNMQVEQLDDQRDELATKRESIAAELSTRLPPGESRTPPRRRLGLVAPASTTYVELKRRGDRR